MGNMTRSYCGGRYGRAEISDLPDEIGKLVMIRHAGEVRPVQAELAILVRLYGIRRKMFATAETNAKNHRVPPNFGGN